MKRYEFTLILRNVDDQTPGLEDHLYEAGCDDALINFRNCTVYLDFSRKAASFEHAVLSAIKHVEMMTLGASVVSVAPEDLVSESEIARRFNLKKQAVSLWIKGLRRTRIQFPHPVMKLSEASPLWRFHEVVAWMLESGLIKEKEILDQSIFIKNLNLVLEERAMPGHNIRANLMDLLTRK